MAMRLLLLIGFLFSSILHLTAQSEETFEGFYKAANKAYEENKYESFLKNLRKADDLRPNQPNVVSKLAAAWALTGRKIKSIQRLNQMLLMDASFNFIDNPDFDKVRNHKNYQQLVALQSRLLKPQVYDELFQTIDAAHLHPESFVILDNGEMLLGSIREKKIVKLRADGTMTDWLETPYAVLGMKVDFIQGNLWVSTAAIPEMKDYDPADSGKSMILQVRLRDGKIIQGIDYEDESTIGDLAVDGANRIWLSNSLTPYLTRDGTDTTQYLGAFNRKQFDLSDRFFNLQGLTLTDDEKYLYVSDYVRGIIRINIEEVRIEEVLAPETSLLKGIDGLYFYKNTLIAVHRGTKPYRIVQYFLSENGLNVQYEDVINRGGESLGEPTLGQIKDGYFYYLANSPWTAYDDDGNFVPSRTKSIEIRRIRLD